MSIFSLRVGLRYSYGKGVGRFARFITLFGLVGMALGVMSLIIVLSVMNGFDRDMRQRLATILPDVHIAQKHPFEDTPELRSQFLESSSVVAFAPFVEGNVLLRHGAQTIPVKLVGIDPTAYLSVVIHPEIFEQSQLDNLTPSSFQMVLSRSISRQLGLMHNARFELVLPQFSVTPAGVFPKVKTITLLGEFSSGSQIDAERVFMHISDVRRLLGIPATQIDGYQIRTNDRDNATAELQAILGSDHPWLISLWSDPLRELFAAMRMEKRVVSLLLGVIVLVAAFNIVAGLVLMVSDKRPDIAILRTLGASTNEVMQIFIVQGMTIGLTGIAIGALLGCLIALYLNQIMWLMQSIVGWFNADFLYLIQMPSDIRSVDVATILGAAFGITLLATLFPAWRAAKIPPSEALSYRQ